MVELRPRARHSTRPRIAVVDDALFVTKSVPPSSVVSSHERTHLLDRLSRSHSHLFLIRAAAGFGKTTLMRQWWDRLSESGVTCAWLTIDEGDNDPARLIAGITTAITRRLNEAGVPVDGEATFSGLRDAIEASTTEFMFLIDNIEFVTSPEALGVLQMLLRSASERLRLTIAGRSMPGLGQARLRLAQSVLDVDADDLRFRSDEISAFCSRRVEQPLTSAQMSQLQQQTSGWPAALQLACLSMREAQDVDHALASTDVDRNMAEYLQDDVLDRQSPETRQFLLFTSILRNLCGPLCNALTGRMDGHVVLERLHADGLFLKQISSESGEIWYAYHSLFATFLRHQLGALGSAQIAALHRAASEWLEREGMIAEAAYHARASGDDDRALRLLDGIAMEHIWQGRLRTVLGWATGLTAEHAVRYERLFVAYIWSEGFVGNADLALRRYADLAAQSRSRGDISDFLKDSLVALPVMIAGATLDFQTLRDDGPAALAKLSRAGTFEHGTLANCVAYGYMVLGDLDNATSTLAAARLACSRAGRTYNFGYTLSFEAQICLERLDIDGALMVLRPGYERISTEDSEFSQSSALVAGCLAEVLYEGGHVDEAALLLERHLSIIDETLSEVTLSAYLTLARIANSAGDRERAREIVKESENLAYRRDASTLLRASRWFEAWLDALDGRSIEARSRCRELAAQERCLDGDLMSPIEGQVRDIYRIRVLLALGETEGLHGEIDELVAHAAARGFERRALMLEVLKCVVVERTDGRASAVQRMRACLEGAVERGFVQTFLDQGSEVHALAYEARKLSVASRSSPHWARLDAGLHRRKSATTSAAATPITGGNQLTAREAEIINAAEKGLTNREIAECFSLSENTVKWHLRNIFDKLGVGTRTEAIFMRRTRSADA